MKYNLTVTDTFKKIANNIIMNVRNGRFIPKMTQYLVSYQAVPSMKAFVAEFPKTRAALSPKKA